MSVKISLVWSRRDKEYNTDWNMSSQIFLLLQFKVHLGGILINVRREHFKWFCNWLSFALPTAFANVEFFFAIVLNLCQVQNAVRLYYSIGWYLPMKTEKPTFGLITIPQAPVSLEHFKPDLKRWLVCCVIFKQIYLVRIDVLEILWYTEPL